MTTYKLTKQLAIELNPYVCTGSDLAPHSRINVGPVGQHKLWQQCCTCYIWLPSIPGQAINMRLHEKLFYPGEPVIWRGGNNAEITSKDSHGFYLILARITSTDMLTLFRVHHTELTPRAPRTQIVELVE